MTVLDRLGPPVDDRDDWTPLESGRCDRAQPIAETDPPTARRRLWPRIGFVAFAIGVAAGWLVATLLAPSSPATGDVPSAIPPTVASTAEMFTLLYLNGTSGEEISRFYGGEPPTPGGVWVNNAAAIAAERTVGDRWEVTVAVDSLEFSEGTYVPVALGFYVVAVSGMGSEAVVLGPPARVPGPVHRPKGNPEPSGIPADQAEVAARFVELYLEGDHSAQLMAANPEDISWFASGPYLTVTTEAVGSDELGRAIVAAHAITRSGVSHHLEYLVTLRDVDREWLVAEIGPVPA